MICACNSFLLRVCVCVCVLQSAKGKLQEAVEANRFEQEVRISFNVVLIVSIPWNFHRQRSGSSVKLTPHSLEK